MKHFVLLLSILTLFSCNKEKGPVLILENSLEVERVDAPVKLLRQHLEQHFDLSEQVPVIKDKEGNYVPCQLDDVDGDGRWDELFLVSDFKAKERKELSIELINPSVYPKFTVRTNIRMASKKDGYKEVREAIRETHAINTETQKVWQMEGPGFENDKIGFRNYFDQRNGMDIFGKVTAKMALDQAGDAENPDYHTFDPSWGMDILKVGNSLGSGAIACYMNDSLYRVGDNGEGTFRLLSEGPLRSIFRFEFMNWEMDGKPLHVIHDITIQAGTYYFESKMTYSGIAEDISFATGIVNDKSDSLFTVDCNEGWNAFYTHDIQSLDTTILGMAILVSDDYFDKTFDAEYSGPASINHTYALVMNAEHNLPVFCRFYAVWEKEDEKWKDRGNFAQFLQMEAKLAANPIRVSFE
jgi:hypothetical protein